MKVKKSKLNNKKILKLSLCILLILIILNLSYF